MLMLDGICKITLYIALVCGTVLIFASIKVSLAKRLRWSRGSVLAFGTQGRCFKPRPKPSDFFNGKKKTRTNQGTSKSHTEDEWRKFCSI
jgi:hypothetical protein